MQEYTDKEDLIAEINKAAELFIGEFSDVTEIDKSTRYDGVDRSPQEIIAYQLGWMELIRCWDKDEADGRTVITPAPGYKWNKMGGLYQSFYDKYQDKSINELRVLFVSTVVSFIEWLNCFSDDELFKPGGRKWAASTTANWPVWKWVHINTVAPFKSFRGKIRKWKKLKAAQ